MTILFYIGWFLCGLAGAIWVSVIDNNEINTWGDVVCTLFLCLFGWFTLLFALVIAIFTCDIWNRRLPWKPKKSKFWG